VADQVFSSERVCLSRPGSTATHIHGRRPTGAAQQRRHAGQHIFIRRVTDLKPRDISDEILRAGAKHNL